MEAWQAYTDAGNIDPEQVIDGGLVVTLPDDLAQLLHALEGEVHCDPQAEICSSFDEEFDALSKGRLRTDRLSGLGADLDRAAWIVDVLDHRGLPMTASYVATDLKRCSDALVSLWSAFLCSEPVLSELIVACTDHPAGAVRDAAALIAALPDPSRFPELGFLSVARRWIAGDRQALAIAPPAFVEREATGTIRKILLADPSRRDVWDNLAYALYNEKKWEEMGVAAAASIAVEPGEYAWMQLGIARMELKDPAGARAAFDAGLCWGQNPNLWLNQATLHIDEGEFDLAVRHLRCIPKPQRASCFATASSLEQLSGHPGFNALLDRAPPSKRPKNLAIEAG